MLRTNRRQRDDRCIRYNRLFIRSKKRKGKRACARVCVVKCVCAELAGENTGEARYVFLSFSFFFSFFCAASVSVNVVSGECEGGTFSFFLEDSESELMMCEPLFFSGDPCLNVDCSAHQHRSEKPPRKNTQIDAHLRLARVQRGTRERARANHRERISTDGGARRIRCGFRNCS